MTQTIKNSAGKTICKVNTVNKEVEILHKGIRTIIRFTQDVNIEIKNEEM